MAEGSITAIIRKIVFKAEPYLPQVPKPKKKIPLQTRLLWCGVALLIKLRYKIHKEIIIPRVHV